MNETTLTRHLRREDNGAHTDPQRQKSASGREIYTAYDTRDRLIRLDIRKANGSTRAPLYSSYVDISYGRKRYSGFVLYFHHMMVTVEGRNLKPVIQALKANRCQFIEEMSDAFEPPTDGEPIITRIEVDTKWQAAAIIE